MEKKRYLYPFWIALTILIIVFSLRVRIEKAYAFFESINLLNFIRYNKVPIPLAALLDPPLTTVSAPAYQMGRTAMRMLQSLIDGKRLPQTRIMLPTALVVRQSCGEHGLK
jgi:hypothetical protein